MSLSLSQCVCGVCSVFVAVCVFACVNVFVVCVVVCVCVPHSVRYTGMCGVCVSMFL